MLSVDEARAHVLERIEVLRPVELSLDSAYGLVAAEDVTAGEQIPRFDNSAMDGYAVRSSDTAEAGSENPLTLQIVGEVRATGGTPPSLRAGESLRIATGAPLPLGADAVVPIEDVNESGSRVVLQTPAAKGQHVRRGGEDLRAGDLAVPSGITLEAGEMALLAALGHDRVLVRPRPKVAVLVTGDELAPPTERAGPGEIYDSNSTAMIALVKGAGAELVLLERVADTPEGTSSALERAGAASDIVVSCGGVSVGRYDFVKGSVAELGKVDQWRVAMQPGKPVVTGNLRGVPFIGLPGNPVSVHVTFEQFVRPALRKMSGHRSWLRPRLRARLTQSLGPPKGRRRFVRVRLSTSDGEHWDATPTGAQGSHNQSSLVDCHGLAVVPENLDGVEVGDTLTVEVWKLPEGR